MTDKKTFKDSDSFYKLIFENLLDGFAYCQMVFDTQGHPIDFIYLLVNKNFEKLTGLKEVVGKKVTEIMPEILISNPGIFEIYGRVSLTGVPERFETYIKPLASWFLVSAYSPKKEFFVAIFQNITDRKLIEQDLENSKIAARNVLEDLQVEKEALAQGKAKEEAMLASIVDGVITVDPAGKITFMNQSAQNSFGLKNTEVMDKSLFDIVRLEDEKGEQVMPIRRPITIVLKTGITFTTREDGEHHATDTKTRPGIYYYVRRDKTRFPVAITAAPVMLENRIVGAIEVFRDVTKELEVDRAKTEFVSLASHELRTPLTAIDGLVSMILDGEYGEVNQNLKRPLEDVSTSSERLILLVNDLLSLSRIQAGRMKYSLTDFPIAPVIAEVVHLLQPLSEQKGLQLTAPKLEEVFVQGDSDKVKEVLNNLIGNSLKFTDKGMITVSTKVNGDMVEIYITDTGIGITKEDQAKLFGQFQQLGSGKGGSRGTGLGLHISREMVRKMGGELWIEKSEPEKGSTFIFSIPKSKSKLAQKVKGEIEKQAKEITGQKSVTIKQGNKLVDYVQFT